MHLSARFYEEDTIVYPNTDTVITIHGFVYAKSQRSDDMIAQGAPNRGNIEGALAHVRGHVGRRGPRRTRVITKAAHLMLRLMASHSFTDGNKRTAFVTGMLFLTMNGYTMKSINEYERSLRFFKRTASKHVHDKNAIRSLRAWITRRIEDYTEPTSARVP